MNDTHPYTILGIDYGDSRTGVARANSIAKIAEPIKVIVSTQDTQKMITDIIDAEEAKLVVVGVPLVSSSTSQQQQKTLAFINELRQKIKIPIVAVDEAYTSLEADETIVKLGKYSASNDAYAACKILERYFTEGALQNV